MLIGVRVLVFIAYLVLAASFVAGTAVLFWEFGPDNGLLFATHDSHLFLFFPTLGVVALAAFYLPSCAFVDLYWRHVRFGKVRLLLGLAVLSALSYWVASGLMESPYRSVWDLTPQTLAADKNQPVGCGGPNRPCERVALLDGVRNVAIVSRQRFGLADFVRTCKKEPLIAFVASSRPNRFCFASTPLPEGSQSTPPELTSDDDCCRAQESYQSAITQLYQPEAQRSKTGQLHKMMLPAKVFFLLVLLAISILLALHHNNVTKHYSKHISRIEISVLVGAFAMLFFPLMSQGFLQTADALYGAHQEGGFKPMVPVMSFFFGAWALLLLLFFFRRRDTETEIAAKLAGVAASMFAVVKYDLIVAGIIRYLGSGAQETSIIVLGALAVIAFLALSSSFARRIIAGDRKDDSSQTNA